MAPSSPKSNPSSSFIVDLEKGPDPHSPSSEDGLDPDNGSSSGSSSGSSTAASTNNHSPVLKLGNNKTIHDSITGAPSSSPVHSGPSFGLFAGLRRLFVRNPATVISGRYSVNFRQALMLLVLITTMAVLWWVTGTAAYKMDMGTESQWKAKGLGLGENMSSAVPLVLTEKQKAAAKERYERVRGKGCRSSLKKIQFAFGPESAEDRVEREKRLEAVRAGFAHAWNGYRTHAWGHDEVYPVSGGHKDNFNGWGATMIDSLDTLVLMGFHAEFDEALEWVRTKFDMTKDPTSMLQFFETVIRYLGGFLSAYDLTGEQVLLDKAEELGDYMLNAFQRSLPSARVAVKKSANRGGGSSFVLAEVGTIQVEFTRLSKLTNNPIYEEKARKVFEILGTAKPQLPGLLPSYVQDAENHVYNSYTATVGGMVDSYYEYLLKEWILLDGEAPEYRETFEQAVDSMHQYMVSRPENGAEDIAILGAVSSSTKFIGPEMEHLGCFVAGSLAMGSKYFDRPEDMVLAKQVAQACYLSYHHSETGIGPEAFKFDVAAGTNGEKFVVDPKTFYNRGKSRSEYILRPETLESLWILYRLTGERKYQDQAWEIFQSLEKNCRTKIAYSGLRDVNHPGSYNNNMESFFMAETLKYLYLMFSTPDVLSLDSYVFNTEAHPVRRT